VIARIVFGVFLLLALLGDARIFLFALNRFVFGSHRREKSPWGWLIYVVPPLLIALTSLFWVVGRWFDQPNEVPLPASIGAAWLIIAAAVGGYWLLDRIRLHAFGEPALVGIRSAQPEVIRLRKAHVPFAFLRNLGAHNDVYDIEVTRHEIIIDDLPEVFDGYRIAFLTDTHVAPIMRLAFYREVVAQVTRFDPDVVLLGGDFVTWHRHIPLMAELLLTDLHAHDGVFAVLGNHDYWAGAEEVMAAMRAKGVRFLINRSVTIERGGEALPIVGIDEMYRGEPDPERAFANVDPARPCIALSHHPDIIDLVRGRRIDLMLCGHTHGGQIRFPFFGAVVVPSRHEAAYASGFHRVGNVLMYVSRGIGAIPPLRILCRPEVATFILRRGKRTT
jgi:predicted MPP superfamily phosphohydrolase